MPKKKGSRERADLDYSSGYNSDNAFRPGSGPSYPHQHQPHPHHRYPTPIYQYPEGAAGFTPTRLQLAAYDNYGYSNPAYAIPAYSSAGSYKMPLSQSSSSRKSRYAVTSADSSNSSSSGADTPDGASRRRRSLKIMVIVAVVVLVLIVALAIGIGVYLSVQQMSDNRSEGEEPETTTLPPFEVPIVETSLKVTNLNYSIDLSDPTSSLYQSTKGEMEDFFDASLRNSNLSDVFNRTEVVGFQNGSVVVLFIIYFREFKTPPSQENRQTIEEIKKPKILIAVITEGFENYRQPPFVVYLPSITVDVIFEFTTPGVEPTTVTSSVSSTAPTLTATLAPTTSSETSTTTSEETTTLIETTTTSSDTTTVASSPEVTTPVSETTSVSSEGTMSSSEETSTATESTSVSSEGTMSPSEETSTATESASVSSEDTTSPSEGTTKVSETSTMSSEGTIPSSEETSTVSETFTMSSEGTMPSSEGTSTVSGTSTMSSEGTMPSSEGTSTVSGTSTMSSEGTMPSSEGTSTMSETSTMSSEGTTSPSEGTTKVSKTSTMSSEGTMPSSEGTSTVSETSTMSSEGTTSSSEGTSTVSETFTMSSVSSEGTMPSSEGTSTMSETSTLSSEDTTSSSEGTSTVSETSTMSSEGTTSSSEGSSAVSETATTPSDASPTESSEATTISTSSTTEVTTNVTEPVFMCTLTEEDSPWQEGFFNTSSPEFGQLAESIESEVDMYMSTSDAGPVYDYSQMEAAYPGSVVMELHVFLNARASLTEVQQQVIFDELTGSNGPAAMQGYFLQGLERFKANNVPARVFSKITFVPLKDVCPKWGEVQKVLITECKDAYRLWMAADNEQDACMYYAVTMRCAAIVLHIQQRNCSVLQLYQRMYNSKSQSFVKQQAKGIDVRHQHVCPLSSLQFSVDLDSTPLCENPDALLYIIQYVPVDDDGMRDHSGGASDEEGSGSLESGSDSEEEGWSTQTSTKPPHSTGHAGTATGPSTWPTHSMFSSFSSYLGIATTTAPTTGSGSEEDYWYHPHPQNPCIAAAQIVSHALSVLDSMELHCDYQNVFSTMLLHNTSATTELHYHMQRCDDYEKGLSDGPDKCFNLTDLSEICGDDFFDTFFAPGETSDVCSSVEHQIECLSTQDGCSEERVSRAMADFFGFHVTMFSVRNLTRDNANIQAMSSALFCDVLERGPSTTHPPATTHSPYSTPMPRPGLETELRFAARLKVSMPWNPHMMNPNSFSFMEAAHKISQVVDAAFVNSNITALYAYSKVIVLWEGTGVQAYVEIYLYIDYNPQYHAVYEALSSGTDYISEQFYEGLGQIPLPTFTFLEVVFLLPGEDFPMLGCPDWDSLWTMVDENCRPSVRALEMATSVETLCDHYVSSLKCALIVARSRHYHCAVEELEAMALGDTWVFTQHQLSGYNASQVCQGKISFMADPNEVSVCVSPDAYLYIADYICKEHPDGPSPTPYPYHTTKYPYGHWTTPGSYPTGHWNTAPWTGYWTTKYPNPTGPWTTAKYPSPTGQWPTTAKYPSPTGQWPTTAKYPNPTGQWPTTAKYPSPTGQWPTTAKYPSPTGQWPTTAKYPSPTGQWPTTAKYPNPTGQWPTTAKYPNPTGQWVTTKYPYPTGHWTTYKNPHAWMPPYEERPCSVFVQRAECIHHWLTYLNSSCPVSKVYQTLIQYNETILTEDIKQCEEDGEEVLSDKCYDSAAFNTCPGALAPLFGYDKAPNDACKWWYGEVMECASIKLDDEVCPLTAVHSVWYRYLHLLNLLRHFDPVIHNLNNSLVEEVFHCSPDQLVKQECPSFKDILQLSSVRCYTILASLVSPNSSLSDYIGYGISFGDTAHMPHTLQQRCRLYGDLLRCLSLCLHKDYECDTKDLHETSENHYSTVLDVFGFYPWQCTDSVPDKLEGLVDVCKSVDLFELLANYECSDLFNAPAWFETEADECLDFFGGVSCMASSVSRIMQDELCTDDNVMSVLRTATNSTVLKSIRSNFSSCFDREWLVGSRGEVLMWRDSRWAAVCPEGWGAEEALLVCNKLGFQYGHAFSRNKYSHVDRVGPIGAVLPFHQCGENDTKGEECFEYCPVYGQIAAVSCSNVELNYELIPDKPGENYGYINVTRDSGSGLLCSPHVDQSAAASLCRAAGYENGGTVLPFSLDPPIPGKVWRTFLSCDSDSEDVEGCVYHGWQFGPEVWANDTDGMLTGFPCDGVQGYLVKVFCFDKPVKLHTGLFNSSGVPQIFRPDDKSAQQAFPFCRSGFDNFTADLFCKEIGFTEGGVNWGFNPYDYSHYRYYRVNCTGQEERFTDCLIEREWSQCPGAAVVRCHDDPEGVENLDVELLGPDQGFSRRLVLVYYDGEWGTICADSWTEADADTICRSAGYEGGFAGRKDRGDYLPHLLHDVACDSNSTSLGQCQWSKIDSQSSDSCRYTEAAAITCYNSEDLAGYRLGGGPTNSSGFVYVDYNGTDGLLCADLGLMHYDVLCRSLGFVSGERYMGDTPLPAVTTVWGTDFTWSCDGDALGLESCREGGWRQLYHSVEPSNATGCFMPYRPGGFAAVFCYDSRVRLNTGFQNKTGILQLYYDDRYQDVCLEGLTYSALDALCQNATGRPGERALSMNSSLFLGLQNEGGVLLSSSCLESGAAVETCVEKQTLCSMDQLAAVHCYDGAVSDEITSWALAENGIVFVEKYGTLGTVCSDHFDDTAARLFCQSQGYVGGTAGYAKTEGRLPLWIQDVQCPYGASQFSECTVVHAFTGDGCFTEAAAIASCSTHEDNKTVPLPRSCPDWDVVWYWVSDRCRLSFEAAKYSHVDRCSHYAGFLKCATFVMRAMKYDCSKHHIQEMADYHFGHHHHTPGPGTPSSEYYGHHHHTPVPGMPSSEYYSTDVSDWYSSDSAGSSWDGSGSSGDYSSTSSLIDPSYTDAMHGGSSGHYDSSQYVTTTGHHSGAYSDGNEMSLPDICKGYEAPSLVDMEKIEPCANPDAYLYILKYHCNDMYYTTTAAYTYWPDSSRSFSSHGSSGSDFTHSTTEWPSTSVWSSFGSMGSSFSDSWSGSMSGSSGTASWSDGWSSLGPSATASHSTDHGWSWGYTTSAPYYTMPQPSAPQNGCRTLSQKTQCIQQHLQSQGLSCPTSTIHSTVEQYSSAVLTTEVHMCLDFMESLKKDECFQAITKDKPGCLNYFHDISAYHCGCSPLQQAIQCSIQNYPGKCRHDNTAIILRHWLSAERFLDDSSDSLGISISDNAKENLFHCAYYQAKEGCPSYEVLTYISGRALGSIFQNVNISNSTTVDEFCSFYKDILAASMLTTAEYPNCSVQNIHQLYLDHDDEVHNVTGFFAAQCQGQLTLPQIDKNEDLCQNSYFMEFLAGGQNPCGYTNLSTPADPFDGYRRSLDALNCYSQYSGIFLPPSLKCSRDAVIQGLKANPQYLHSSYHRYLDSDVMLTHDNMVLVRIGSEWSQVCETGWDDSDALVFCRSLGFNVGYGMGRYQYSTMCDDMFGSLAKDFISNVECSGQENSLLECPYEQGGYCYTTAQAVCYMSDPVYKIVSDKEDTHYGYVKRSVNGRDAFITTAWLSDREADIFCQAAGYPHGGVTFPRHLPDIDMGMYRWHTSLSCYDDDMTIEECGHWTYENVLVAHEHPNGSVSYVESDYYRPVKVFCFNSTVRLHNSLLNSTGIALFPSEASIMEPEYRGICRDGFTDFTASLFCRDLGLGFESGQTLGYQPFKYYQYSGLFINVSCDGTETQISECRNTTVSYHCTSGFAVVTCMPQLEASDEAVPDMTVKLDHDGQTVLIYKNNSWGYICDDHWTDREAEKVCKIFGFDVGFARQKTVDSTFLPYFIHNVSCEEADSWEECVHEDVDSDVCIEQSPARVFCFNQSDLPIFSLYNGKDGSRNYGWVHVTREGSERRLCADFYSKTHYQILCRELGFFDGEEYWGNLPQRTDLLYWATDSHDCEIDTPLLAMCSTNWEGTTHDMHWTSSNGSHVEYYCKFDSVKAFCYDKKVRVHSGYFNTSGVLEVADSGTFHPDFGTFRPVCAQSSSYTQEAADVVCHSLTNSTSSSAIMVRRNVFMFTSKAKMHVSFSCDGTEEDVDQCMTVNRTDDYNSDCNYDETLVAVVCYQGEQPADGITEWKIGVQDSVLVKRFGLWGHVCALNWTNNEAATVCRMLGHYSGVAIPSEAWGTNLAQWVDDMSCPADASHVSECSIAERDYTLSEQPDYMSCHARRAKCFEEWEEPHFFFADNSTARQGRVAVTYLNSTGYYCSSSVYRLESYSTLCRIMGFPRGGEELDHTLLGQPDAYLQSWRGHLTCGQWDRPAHSMFCFTDWKLENVYDMYSGALSWCGEHIPAVSCYESEEYRLVSASGSKDQGMLVSWNSMKEQWEMVCRKNFTDTEADAACRELGFSGEGQLISEGDKPEYYYPMGGLQFQCSGDAEEKLSTCATFTSYCENYYDPAVWLSCGTTKN